MLEQASFAMDEFLKVLVLRDQKEDKAVSLREQLGHHERNAGRMQTQRAFCEAWERRNTLSDGGEEAVLLAEW